jgi:hypothetical protein
MSNLAAFANLTTKSTRGCCARCLVSYDEHNGARAAVNADLYNRPVGADKQARIAHQSQTVCEPCAAEMWTAIVNLYDFAGYREEQDRLAAEAAKQDAEDTTDQDEQADVLDGAEA